MTEDGEKADFVADCAPRNYRDSDFDTSLPISAKKWPMINRGSRYVHIHEHELGTVTDIEDAVPNDAQDFSLPRGPGVPTHQSSTTMATRRCPTPGHSPACRQGRTR